MWAKGFFHVIARATEGGTDTAELFDSEAIDWCYSDLAHVRIRDDGSVRRAEGFETSRLFSTQNSDRIIYDIPGETNELMMAAGELTANVGGRRFEFGAFRFSTVNFDSATASQVSGSNGNDTLTITPALIRLYSTDYTFNITGAQNMSADDFNEGTDQLILNDTAGDDQLVVDSNGLTMNGDQFEFQSTEFPTMRAVGRGGGTNTATVTDPPAGFQLFGQWDQD